jgi:hypothetical protein
MHLKHLKGRVGALRVDMAGDGVFIHGGFGAGPRTMTRATRTRCEAGANQVMLLCSVFQKKTVMEVEELEAALLGCHGIWALSLFFGVLWEIAWAHVVFGSDVVDV